MEFIQFHPTGMVWPPSVRGILVTEGVRGEGGVLRNNEGKRFMFDDIPENYKQPDRRQTRKKAGATRQGDKNARRPPELLTRDHVARCIMREVKEGRGSPHGGVFLDIAWIKEKLPNAAEHIKKKLPSMYHQFKELADIDITKEPMEVGPTTHYIMGGVRVDGDTQMSTRARAVRRRRVRRRASTAPTGWAATRCPTCWSSASAPASTRRSTPRSNRRGQRPRRPGRGRRPRWALAPFERAGGDEGPFQVQHDLQDMMQDLVGIVRSEDEMQQALDGLAGAARARAATVGVRRQPRVQPRLAHGARPAQPADRLRGDRPLGPRAQGEPRRPVPRRLSRTRTRRSAKFNIVVARAPTAACSCAASRSRRCPTS